MTRHDRLRIEEAIENDNFDKLIRLKLSKVILSNFRRNFIKNYQKVS